MNVAYLVFDIGCIECDEDSSVVGIYADAVAANAAIKDYLDEDTSWGRVSWHGQYSIEVFEVELPEELLLAPTPRQR